jgi:hypothetical protein
MSRPHGRAADTDLDADTVQLEAYRRMGGMGRAQVAFRLSDQARRIAMAGIRARHPDYDERRVLLAWARLVHGDELVRAVWPGDKLVDP